MRLQNTRPFDTLEITPQENAFLQDLLSRGSVVHMEDGTLVYSGPHYDASQQKMMNRFWVNVPDEQRPGHKKELGAFEQGTRQIETDGGYLYDKDSYITIVSRGTSEDIRAWLDEVARSEAA